MWLQIKGYKDIRRIDMENDELNKYLTEAIGECWHDWEIIENTPPFRKYRCDKCETERINPESYNDFLKWGGFGKLWEWVINQEWWHEFLHEQWKDNISYVQSEWFTHLVDPSTFAKAIADFLQKK